MLTEKQVLERWVEHFIIRSLTVLLTSTVRTPRIFLRSTSTQPFHRRWNQKSHQTVVMWLGTMIRYNSTKQENQLTELFKCRMKERFHNIWNMLVLSTRGKAIISHSITIAVSLSYTLQGKIKAWVLLSIID